MKRIIITLLTLLFCVGFENSSAQKLSKAESIYLAELVKKQVDSRSYRITISQINAKVQNSSLAKETLSGEFYLQITPEKITSFLPFYGRDRLGHDSMREKPLEFESTDFTYKLTQSTNKKGTKSTIAITCVPDGKAHNVNFNIVVYPEGYATIDVWSNSITEINYKGIIGPAK